MERNNAMNELLIVNELCRDGILDKISFSMKKGEMTAVMGPSGSGKSTLLYNIAGMDCPTGGSVLLDGREITSLSEDERADMRLRETGFVFQQMNMLKGLNILDNILLPAVHANKGKNGRTRAELAERADMLMKKLSVSDIAQRRIWQVSGGQLQRACICRSMMNDPKIIFADEPTGALNKSASAEVMAELSRLSREGTAILTVTHDSRAASCCDRVLYLSDGRICGEILLGKPEKGTEKEREDELNRQLAKMGW